MSKLTRRPRAEDDLIEIWSYIADDNETAADRQLERIDRKLRMLAGNPELGRARPELLPSLRSFPVGSYVIFYVPRNEGIEVVRILSGYLDIGAEDMLRAVRVFASSTIWAGGGPGGDQPGVKV